MFGWEVGGTLSHFPTTSTVDFPSISVYITAALIEGVATIFLWDYIDANEKS